MESGLTDNIHLTATEGNGQPGFRRSEPPARTEGAPFATSEDAKARNCLSFDRFSEHLSFLCSFTAEVRSRRRLTYPALEGRAAIRPIMLANSLLVR